MHMVYGQNIDTLYCIKDTTPGIISILTMIIMLLLLNIVYQICIILWNSKKMEQLNGYEKIIRKGMQKHEIRPGEKKPAEGKPIIQELSYKDRESDVDKEILKVFNALKR